MSVSSLLPTTRPLSLSTSTRHDNNNDIHRVSFSPIAYPKLSHLNSTSLLPVKSSTYNVQIFVEEDEPEDQLISRFSKEVIKAGVFRECRRKRFFENPIDKAKRKQREAAKRNRPWRGPYLRTPEPSDTPNEEKVDDDEEDGNWDLLDIDVPYT